MFLVLKNHGFHELDSNGYRKSQRKGKKPKCISGNESQKKEKKKQWFGSLHLKGGKKTLCFQNVA
jgi:hypothetical protein